MYVDLWNADNPKMQFYVHSGKNISIYENAPGQMAVHVLGTQHPSVYYPTEGRWKLEVRP